MEYISFGPDNDGRPLSFYLAAEEYVARHVEADDCFFMWRVEPSVIFGRNQLIENEVNTDYCREHGIRMYRRKSGGGCVYADMGNVMLSYITREENVNFTFNRYMNMLVLVLYKMGIEAKATGRNDILINGRKVSGNAFYHIPGRSIVHGTLLYDTHMEHMAAAITPSLAKLESKGVESVRQHVALLKDYTTMRLTDIMTFFRNHLCHGEMTLDNEAINEIEHIERGYLDDAFIYGHNPRYSVVRRKRIDGVGDIEARMELKNGIIKQMELLGDFFVVGDLNTITHRLRNVALERSALDSTLPDHLDDIILHLDKPSFINLLINP
ncbi:MAG: lipoate--protein ligase [Prevotella sp.]|nr:lipoate--protein ligase [Prevotella sp.]